MFWALSIQTPDVSVNNRHVWMVDMVTSPPHVPLSPNQLLLQMMESCSTAAASGIRSDRAALKEMSWAAASCSHATSPPMVTDFFTPSLRRCSLTSL